MNFYLKIFNFCCFELQHPSTIIPKLTLSTDLMRNQCNMLRSAWMSDVHLGPVVKVSSHTNTSSQIWTLNTTCIFDGFGLTVIWCSLGDRPTSYCGQQCRRQHRWMINYLQVGGYFLFLERKHCVTPYICLIEKILFSSKCNCNTVQVIVCPQIKH
jgi:hypothetical protein